MGKQVNLGFGIADFKIYDGLLDLLNLLTLIEKLSQRWDKVKQGLKLLNKHGLSKKDFVPSWDKSGTRALTFDLGL
jgi:hypothetical protein